jgi:hypothetical protein
MPDLRLPDLRLPERNKSPRLPGNRLNTHETLRAKASTNFMCRDYGVVVPQSFVTDDGEAFKFGDSLNDSPSLSQSSTSLRLVPIIQMKRRTSHPDDLTAPPTPTNADRVARAMDQLKPSIPFRSAPPSVAPRSQMLFYSRSKLKVPTPNTPFLAPTL